jgi:alanyl-tRNA synthetase
VAILASRLADGTRVDVQRAQGSPFDCGAFLEALAAATGGRGGGKPDRAQGTLPALPAEELRLRLAQAIS